MGTICPGGTSLIRRSMYQTTTITTLTPVSVMEIKSNALRLASDASQVQFNKAFMRILIERLTWANAKLVAVSARNSPGGAADLLPATTVFNREATQT